MWRITVGASLLTIAVLLLGGCDGDRLRDETANPQYNGGFVAGSTYQLTTTVKVYAVTPSLSSPSDQVSLTLMKDVNPDPKHPALGDAPAGTRLRFVRILWVPTRNLESGDVTRAYAEFIDGPFAGRAANISDISAVHGRPLLHAPNPKYLTPVAGK